MSKVIVLALAALTSGAVGTSERWTIDADHSHVGFSVRHMVVTNARGKFKTYTGTIDLDEKTPANTKIDVSIDTGSVDTDNEKRDEHLRSAEFFDSKTHPKMTFKSTKVTKTASGYDVVGDLTIRGVKKSVTLKVSDVTAPVKNPWGKMVRGAHATTEIDRTEFGLKWQTPLEAGGVALDNKVKIEMDLELVKS